MRDSHTIFLFQLQTFVFLVTTLAYYFLLIFNNCIILGIGILIEFELAWKMI